MFSVARCQRKYNTHLSDMIIKLFRWSTGPTGAFFTHTDTIKEEEVGLYQNLPTNTSELENLP